jgi:uncharacterized membrane protein YkoI
MRVRRACLVAGLCFGFSHVLYAEGDHDRARRALQRGEIRPLTAIMQQIQTQLGGEVIEVEFKGQGKGRKHLYEFKILTPSGRISEVLVDAATAEILGREDAD